MTLMSTGMSFFLLKWPNFSPRIASSLKMNGELLVCSRVGVGSIMHFIAPNHTSCSSGDLSIISSNRRISPSRACLHKCLVLKKMGENQKYFVSVILFLKTEQFGCRGIAGLFCILVLYFGEFRVRLASCFVYRPPNVIRTLLLIFLARMSIFLPS